jgi:hypothetical protein
VKELSNRNIDAKHQQLQDTIRGVANVPSDLHSSGRCACIRLCVCVYACVFILILIRC